MLDTLNTHGLPGRPAKIAGTLINLVDLADLESHDLLEAYDETRVTSTLQAKVIGAARGMPDARVLATQTHDDRARCIGARGSLALDELHPGMLDLLLEGGEVVLRSIEIGLVDVTVYRHGIDKWVDGQLVGSSPVDATSERGRAG